MARISCWTDTKERAKLFPVPKTVKYRFFQNQAARTEAAGGGCCAVVDDDDSIDCALKIKAAGANPVVLNLADDCFPGGCVDVGSGAQEESLFRRTNLSRALDISMYPIKDDEVIYSSDVSVFKASEQEGWQLFDAPITLAFISCPGIKFPRLDYPDPSAPLWEARLTAEDAARLRAKFRNILRTARMHGHDVPVLGALGCGAWKNPAPHVARIAEEVIREAEFLGAFERVVFAIKRRVDDMYVVRSRMGQDVPDNHDMFQEVLRSGLQSEDDIFHGTGT